MVLIIYWRQIGSTFMPWLNWQDLRGSNTSMSCFMFIEIWYNPIKINAIINILMWRNIKPDNKFLCFLYNLWKIKLWKLKSIEFLEKLLLWTINIKKDMLNVCINIIIKKLSKVSDWNSFMIFDDNLFVNSKIVYNFYYSGFAFLFISYFISKIMFIWKIK